MTSKKITPTLMKKTMDQIKYFGDTTKNTIAPLVWHIRWCEARILSLELELREYKQVNLDERIEAAKMPQPKVNRDEPVERETLAQRIVRMIDAGETETDAFKLMLKWNKLSEDDAWKIYEGEKSK